MTEKSADIQQAESEHLLLLAAEADSLAAMLDELQEHLSMIPADSFPDVLLESGQALDCGKQGLQDFGSVFRALAQKPTPISSPALREALGKASQHKLRISDIPPSSSPNGVGSDDRIELF